MLEFDNKINLGTVIPLVLFVAGYFVKWGLDAAAKYRLRRRFYIAIFTEIKLNTAQLEKDTLALPPVTIVNKILAKARYRPHMISYNSSDIYKSNLVLLPQLSDVLVKSLISFYNNLEIITIIAKSIENKSFETISVEGRQRCFELFRTQLTNTAKEGGELMDKLKLELKISDVI